MRRCIKKLKKSKKISLPVRVALPTLLSVMAAARASWVFLMLAVAALFAVIALTPRFRGYENIWTFLIGALLMLPTNLRLLSLLPLDFMQSSRFFPTRILLHFFVFLLLLCLEEIVLNLIGRVLWRRQKLDRQ